MLPVSCYVKDLRITQRPLALVVLNIILEAMDKGISLVQLSLCNFRISNDPLSASFLSAVSYFFASQLNVTLMKLKVFALKDNKLIKINKAESTS